MTSLTFDLIDNSTQRMLASGIKTYPEAREKANYAGDCTIKSVYTEYEPKDKTYATHRLVAFFDR